MCAYYFNRGDGSQEPQLMTPEDHRAGVPQPSTFIPHDFIIQVIFGKEVQLDSFNINSSLLISGALRGTVTA